jgi:hypothetical protein
VAGAVLGVLPRLAQLVRDLGAVANDATRTPSPASLARYFETATRTRPMSPETSSLGRFQFSDENANTVRYSMPRSAHALTVRTSESTPCLWPKKRGMCRFLAQRPFRP